MKVFWKDVPLGDFSPETGLTLQEMRLVKRDLPEFKNPIRLMEAALEIAIEGKGDDEGKTSASEKWDPDAMCMLIAILMRRQGRMVEYEEIDGTYADLRVELSAEEKATQEKAGKALAVSGDPAADAAVTEAGKTASSMTSTSMPGSTAMPLACGSTSA